MSHFSPVWLCATLWTEACQAPLSMGFSRKEHWSVLPCPPPGDLPDPGIDPMSLMSPASAGGFFIAEAPGKPLDNQTYSERTGWRGAVLRCSRSHICGVSEGQRRLPASTARPPCRQVNCRNSLLFH